MMDRISDVGVLDKSMAILGAVEAGPQALAGLVSLTGFPRASTHRLAAALEYHGLLRRDDLGRFALGPRLVELGRLAATGSPLNEAARPVLRELVEATGESAQLYVRDGDRRVCVESIQSPHGLRTIVGVGAIMPLDRGSAGRVLADLDAATRKRGWAASVGEREAGVASVSAPVRDSDGRVRAAVSVSGPIERTTRHPGRLYADAVVAAARSIERAVGWP